MAAVTLRSDFGAQENKVCHCFHFFPICHEVLLRNLYEVKKQQLEADMEQWTDSKLGKE